MTTDSTSRAERKEMTRRAILDAALVLSEQGGLSSISLRQVAKEVGIVPTAFYRHFATIEELGLALVEESMGSLREMLREARLGATSENTWRLMVEIADHSVDTLVRHVPAHAAHFRFIARERVAGPPAVRDAVRHQLLLVESELATDLARVPGSEKFSAGDLRVLANLFVSAMVAHADDLASTERASERTEIAATARKQLHMVLVGVRSWDSSL